MQFKQQSCVKTKANIADGEMSKEANQWYTLHTKPKCEFKVARVLEEAKVEVFLPELHTQRKNRVVKSPFFPCYLFMATDLNEVSSSVWQWTPGLRYMVTCGTQPIGLSADVIRLIQLKMQELNQKQTNTAVATPTFAPGDTVRITRGPLKEMLAIFAGPTKPSRRVHVLLQLLDYQRRIQLDAADIEKVLDMHQGSNRRPRRTRGQGRFITQ